ncbi:FKBP-type peptidyl-prolyl cis-trans isomerase [Helicobacter heilmannii]|uniref:FKBP-type peptidyl-prolyl cis-trans isomerase n=1 Tax=Helicobacter heilmannii TaxID=35817 RepID=UPI0006A20980|nr:peptidylprolyl isomerase [Helicobacter heilmannii]GMB95220.1 FKBP-type peptidyl-prolyl cis-trans isomerase slyD [Helicobacter heilmannii]CRF46436.1 FKBP-type peptidyl-prolyl cis-trans isomerase SlyD [Helicobacter heilmannii]CRF49787.1 FKBP-type peptidyl-prolyl cis-trans isomerase SlyD [Helicobacter heilmannii]CRF50618.1 FKBP-type peptidyl-prolyl cis-trans isomerase SlyD [Helicobacter heilmannii]
MQNQVAIIEYEVRDHATQEVLDSNIGQKPLEFLIGAGQVIAGLEKAVQQAEVGQTLNIVIPPHDAYGTYRTDYLQEVPRDQFEGIELKRGMTLFGQGENNESVQVSVKDFSEHMVMLDYNHPLAGKKLSFQFTLLGLREATEQEVLKGQAPAKQCCGGGCGCSH